MSAYSHPANLETSARRSVPLYSINWEWEFSALPNMGLWDSLLHVFFEDSYHASSDVSWGLTGRQTLPLHDCRCLRLYFPVALALTLPLPLFLSLSPHLMPLSVWRLIKQLPASHWHTSHHQALFTISYLPPWGWRQPVCACAATHAIKMSVLLVFCVQSMHLPHNCTLLKLCSSVRLCITPSMCYCLCLCVCAHVCVRAHTCG